MSRTLQWKKKQAHIKREKTKEELKPFLTILGTSQRAKTENRKDINQCWTHSIVYCVVRFNKLVRQEILVDLELKIWVS